MTRVYAGSQQLEARQCLVPKLGQVQEHRWTGAWHSYNVQALLQMCRDRVVHHKFVVVAADGDGDDLGRTAQCDFEWAEVPNPGCSNPGCQSAWHMKHP